MRSCPSRPCDGLNPSTSPVRSLSQTTRQFNLTCGKYPGLLKGYTLVAHRAGHTLGGCLYTIRPSLSSSLSSAASASSFLFAPHWNHVKEHHLDGAALLRDNRIDETFRRTGVVVIGADRAQVVNTKRVDRERALLGQFLCLN